MSTLQQVAQADPRWDLNTFVQVANDLIPQFIVAAESNSGRSLELINPRLVRYYTAEGVLDRPLRQGKEARYIYRHLLQLLVIRRLLSEGYSISAIQPVNEKNNVDLEALLQGGVQLTVEARNPALAFLHAVKARKPAPYSPDTANKRSAASRSAKKQPSPAAQTTDAASDLTAAASDWKRIVILPGLELHIRHDFAVPATPQEYENLLQLIAHQLSTLFRSWRS